MLSLKKLVFIAFIATNSLYAQAGNGEIGSADHTPVGVQTRCSENTYKYRLELNAKKAAKSIYQFAIAANTYVNKVEGIDTIGSKNLKTGWDRTITIVGSSMNFQNSLASINQKNTEIETSVRILEKSCSQFSKKDLKAAIVKELKKYDLKNSPIYLEEDEE